MASLIMHTCSLQLERGEFKELAPTKGATGAMTLSGGAITVVQYSVFDKHADKVDPKIKQEPWRAFSKVTMRINIEKDPEFEVEIDGQKVEPKPIHKSPGLLLIDHLSTYFPLMPRAFKGQAYKPELQ
jgi:hypothetical protein